MKRLFGSFSGRSSTREVRPFRRRYPSEVMNVFFDGQMRPASLFLRLLCGVDTMSTLKRYFTLVDAVILIAATAGGFALLRPALDDLKFLGWDWAEVAMSF